MKKLSFKTVSVKILSFILMVCIMASVMPMQLIAEGIDNLSSGSEQSQGGAQELPLPDISDILDNVVDDAIDDILKPDDSSGSGNDSGSDFNIKDNVPTGETETAENTVQFRLNKDGKSYSVVGFLSSGDTLVIPETYTSEKHGTLPVTRIEEFAFQNKTNLVNVTIPSSIEYIGTEAFSGCDNLKFEKYGNANYLGNDVNKYLYLHSAVSADITEVDIHNDTKFIGSYAFLNCKSLTEISVPESVKQIGFKAFRHTDKLEKITLPFVGEMGVGEENSHFGYIFGAQTFGGNISYVPTSLREVVILGGERLTKGSFYGMDMIESLTLPFVGATKNGTENTHISYIYGYDDYNGNANLPASLTDITILSGDIGAYAFYYCTGLERP